MNFEAIKRFFELNAYRFPELGKDYVFYLSKRVANLACLSVADNMLSIDFLQFLIDSKLKFAIFPAFDKDLFNYDIQIEFD